MIGYEGAAWPSLLLMKIVTIAGRAVLLAAGAGLGLAAFRVKSTSLRLFTWTSVLYAVAAISIIGWMLPPIAVPLPTFLQSVSEEHLQAVSTPVRPHAEDTSVANTTAPQTHALLSQPSKQAMPTLVRGRSDSPIRMHSIPWSAIAFILYFAVAALLLGRLVVGLCFTRRLMRRSEMIQDSRVARLLSSSASNVGVRATPQMAESEFISVPVTVGIVQPMILLPVEWRQWEDAKLEAVIAHELSHVVRHDALTQLVSLLHRAVFWFSPLAWWLDLHLKNLEEQASDEAALFAGANCNDYARTLLGFFERLQVAPQRIWWLGVSMAHAGRAEERVERILAWRGAVTMGFKKSIAIIIVACAIPVVYLAASVRPVQAREGTVIAATGQEQAPAVAPRTETAAPPSSAPAVAAPRAEPVAPIASDEASEPVIAEAPQRHRHGYSYSYGYDDEQRFVIVSGKTDAFTMSGSSEDARHVEKLRKQIPGDFIWFQRDEKSYIIRDQATVERARKLWAPQEELGAKQEELGKQQEALGKQQEELGARLQRIQVKVPDMTAELDKLRAELKALSSGATAEQVGKIQSEIGELQSKIGEVQSSAGEQQSKIGEEMGALGEKQGKLGEQQGELGRQQGELAERASREMKGLLDEAIKNGTAKPEPQTGDSGTL